MNKLAKIKERLKAATPGPWEKGGMDSGHSRYEMSWWISVEGSGDVVCDMDGLTRSMNEKFATDDGEADADLIAHAPEDLEALVLAVEKIQELHVPNAGHNPECECGIEAGSGARCVVCYEAYPCATIRVIQETL